MKTIATSILCLLFSIVFAQDSIHSPVTKQAKLILGIESIGASASYTALYTLWYKGYDRSSFHFFDDSREWGQMDKLGHAYSSYWITAVNTEMLSWAGLPRQQAILYSSGMSIIFMAGIEVFDGYSTKWGASVYDIAANTSGTLLFAGQELLFQKQVCRMKYSYSESGYAHYRPNALGNTLNEKMLKDYNGQTYWLSMNIRSAWNWAFIPSWLNIATGHSINGFIGGHSNADSENTSMTLTDSKRIRQYFFSVDIDLSKIKTRYKALNSVLYALNCIKFPAPTLEITKGKVSGHWLYF